MLTEDEEKFLVYWYNNREREKSLRRRLSAGVPIGLLIGVGIILNFVSGWYTRATMVANSQSTPLVLIIAVVLIALFFGYFYKQFQWEMNEQRFAELNYKKETEKSAGSMQQDDSLNSQVSK